MIRLYLIVTCLAISLMSIGCCGPIGCGVGCGFPLGCNSCDGLVDDSIPCGPLDAVRRMKRNLTCGSGCGEVYRGEWRSTPRDCQDPCCNDQWVGGATVARPFCLNRPFCWQPGSLASRLYGGRFCSGAESSVPCGCGSAICDGGCGDFVEGEIISGGGGSNTGSCGCASCNAIEAAGSGVRLAGGIPASDGMTRSASTRNMDAQVNRIRR